MTRSPATQQADELEISPLLPAEALWAAADLRPLSVSHRRGYPYGLCLALPFTATEVAGLKNGPTRAYGQAVGALNQRLEQLAEHLTQHLEARGYKAWHPTATNAGKDPFRDAVALPHKTVATLAGLGWIGRCGLLITTQYGSALRLITILTHAPLTTGTPCQQSRCGKCRACIQVCPGQAVRGPAWQPCLSRPVYLDAWACRQAARDLAQQKLGCDETLCARCMIACPYTQAYLRRQQTA